MSRSKVFDQIAEEYDRRRPTYPEELLDRICDAASLRPGDPVLEIGCGTGQLTHSLLARGFSVCALEPGERLIARARRNLEGSGEVELINVRLEDAPLPRERFQAAFSASAIHWVDPDVGWRRIAEALLPGGMLALIQCFGVDVPEGADDRHALMRAVAKVAPEIAEGWPRYRGLEEMLAGARARRSNISAVWAWLGSYEVARDYVASLFEGAQIAAIPSLIEQTPEELDGLLGTISFWSTLSPQQRKAIAEEHLALYRQVGRPLRSTIATCAVTARRETALRAA